jgi:hypothetical protein
MRTRNGHQWVTCITILVLFVRRRLSADTLHSNFPGRFRLAGETEEDNPGAAAQATESQEVSGNNEDQGQAFYCFSNPLGAQRGLVLRVVVARWWWWRGGRARNWMWSGTIQSWSEIGWQDVMAVW